MGRNRFPSFLRSAGCVVALVAMVSLVVLVSTAAAGEEGAAPRSGTLHWQKIISGVAGETGAIYGVGDYVFVNTKNPPDGGAAGSPLFNGLTGASSTLSPPAGCHIELRGGPWLLFQCSSADTGDATVTLLYSPSSHKWVAPNPTALSQACSAQEDIHGCTPVRVGTDWIEWDGQRCSQDTHCMDNFLYQNISTGALQTALLSGAGGLYDNPDLPGLTHRLCSPISVPEAFSEYDGNLPVPVAFYGPFAVLEPSVPAGEEDSQVAYLQECGHSLKEKLEALQPDVQGPTGDSKVLIWTIGSRIHYVELPSLTAGTWTLPGSPGSGPASQVVVAGHRIYAHVGYNIWSAVLPAVDR
jgi:hypothetical protein